MDFGTLRVTYIGDPRPAVQAAATVDRVNAQTAKNAERNDAIVARSAKQLADVRTREAKRSADNFIRELERTRRAERAGGRGSGSDALSALTGGRLGGGGAAAAIGLTTAAFAAAAKTGIEYRETIERLTKSFESLLGSSAAAQAHLKDLQSFAARTPFEFEDVARASQRFQNMGLAAKDVIPTLTAVGNAVAAAGGGSEQIDRVSLAISQMAAKGKVSAEEMNQLAEAGVGGWKLLEQQTGKTKAELFKMAEAGELSAETFITAFRQAYGSGNQMQRQMETLSGATSTLKDKGKELLAQAYSPLHGLLKDIAVEAAKLTTEGWKTERMFTALASASENFLDNFLPTRVTGIADQLRQIRTLMGYGDKVPANWGASEGPWGQGAAINIPEQYKYKPRISDEDLAKTQQEAFRRAKEQGVSDILREQTEAQRKAEQASKQAQQTAERQAETVNRLREHLHNLTIENEHFGKSEVEQEIALMRARVAAEDLSGEYRRQADAIANLTATQMRALDVKKQLKEADERERKEEEQRADARLRILSISKAMGDEQLRLRELLSDPAVRDALSVWEAKMLNLLAISRDLKDSFDSTSLLKPSVAPGVQEPTLRPLDLTGAQYDPWKTFRESFSESLEYMREDGVFMFADMFARIGEGWKGALGGLVLDFANALNRMASQAAASAVWGAILNAVGGSFGGLFGGGSMGGVGSAAGGVLKGLGYATGTLSASPGLQWVGERGPELVNFRGGERVFNNSESRQIAQTKTVNLTVNFNGTDSTPRSRQSQAQVARRLADMLTHEMERGG